MFSVSSSDEPDYWAQADYDTWLLEMAGDRSGETFQQFYLVNFIFTRQIIEKFAGIKDQSVVGVRAPYLRVGGDKQFK